MRPERGAVGVGKALVLSIKEVFMEMNGDDDGNDDDDSKEDADGDELRG